MVDGSARTDGFQWGYALAALGFAVLAAFRLNGGSTLWAAIFGLAALANVYLSFRHILPRRLGGVRPPEVGQPGPASPSAEPPPEQMSRALKVYESRTRGWLAITVAGWITTGGVILLSPSLALIGATLSLFSTYRFRRCRRSVRILRRALAVVGEGTDEGVAR